MRISAHAVIRVLHSQSFTSLEKGSLRSAVSGALWTRSRLRDAGYDAPASCQLCGLENDSVAHRVWQCECTADLRAPPAMQEVCARAAAAGYESSTYGLALCPHPEAAKIPPVTAQARFESVGSSFSDGLFVDPTCEVFLDGSCRPHGCPEASRAAWAAVQIDSAGALVRGLKGTVPAICPQSAQAAEHCAMLAAAKASSKGTAFVGDCQGVISSCEAGLGPWLRRKVYGGVIRCAFVEAEVGDSLRAIVKVAAHQVIESISDPVRRYRALGNDAADSLAKSATALHPAAAASDAGRFELASSDALKVAELMAKALARWPSSAGRHEFTADHIAKRDAAAELRRRRRERNLAERIRAAQSRAASHEWGEWGQLQQCRRCFLPRKSGEAFECAGAPLKLFAAASAALQRGHKMYLGVLHRGDGQCPAPFVCCLRCGAWCQTGISLRKHSLLSTECKNPRKRPDSVARVLRGRHPKCAAPYTQFSVETLQPLSTGRLARPTQHPM